jgi:signal transduction histidine kinase/FixJ family two-component response regulator/purine-cytosine permease-like protein
MVGQQRIDRVRREYNKWAANQTLEDFALRFTAKRARRFSAAQVGQTALGAVSFLALEAISGSLTLNYGFTNTMWAILVVSIVIFLTALPICFYAARYGVDIDLLTRGAGFGYIGSTITSLIYASFTFILFAIESSIMAIALDICLGIPRPIGYLISALAVIPLVIYGISAISRFQVWTQPIWILLNVIPITAIAWHTPDALTNWQTFAGLRTGSNSFNLIYFGSAASVALAFIVQVGEQVDFLRFLPYRREKPRAWWIALLLSGPGWIVVGFFKLLAGSFLAVYLFNHGIPRDVAADPPQMYLTIFDQFVGSRTGALALTCVFVVVCQLKINVTNAYAGSIAWSNFFSRLTHTHPGRVVWLVFNVALAVLVMELDVYRALEETLALYSCVAVAWVGAIVADLVISKPLGLSPPYIEFRRAHLYDINPVGVGAMLIGAAVAVVADFGLLGRTLEALAPFLALFVTMACVPALALATRGRFYIAREPEPSWSERDSITCCICENAFEPEDMASCPAYAGPICSLCCSLDARCHDMCKPSARIQHQLETAIKVATPKRLRGFVSPHVVGFILTFGVALALVAVVLALIGVSIAGDGHTDHRFLFATLWKAFFLLAIVVGIGSWLLVLVQISRRAAENEMRRQAQLLMDEIGAHERTDLALKKAKEVAEAANLAKSRYIRGLSHELRTPLNTIMGYAQLLERDRGLGARPRDQVSVMRRSANHLAGLIDGLLDISKIEAGKLALSRDEVVMAPFLAQLIDMFTVQAEGKGINFIFEAANDLPVAVLTDEKRLRQIIINLLSNAIKFTQVGEVVFKVTYRNEVADFVVRDTGPGIAQEDQERIFEPFERLHVDESEVGTGLGLTICRLLAGIMGGDIRVTSQPGVGSAFSLRLFLPRRDQATLSVVGRQNREGSFGAGKTILIVDDDPMHRRLMTEALTPFSFTVKTARNAAEGVAIAASISPDLYFLDIEMPGMDGWELARSLRETIAQDAKVVMLSASAVEEYHSAMTAPFHDAFIMKPVDINLMIETIIELLGLAAPRQPIANAGSIDLSRLMPLDDALIEDLIGQCEIGYVRGLRDRLTRLATEDRSRQPLVDHMLRFVDAIDMRGLMSELERLRKVAP